MPIVRSTRKIPVNFIIFCRCQIVIAFRKEGNIQRRKEREGFENIKRELGGGEVAVLPHNFGIC